MMERLNAYCTKTADGGVNVDTEGLIVDLVTVLKASGIPKEEFLRGCNEIWDEVQVSLEIPDRAKN